MSNVVKPKKSSYVFHPLEWAVIGYSGLGKTTLITKLLQALKETWSIAYVKHDAHRFEMDKPGKDTFSARAAGASAVSISDRDHHALLEWREKSLFRQRSELLDYDAVIVEGWKNLGLSKFCMIGDGSILSELSEEAKHSIEAWIGSTDHKPKELTDDKPYFSRDDISGISHFMTKAWFEKMEARPLRALILAGGRSQRMAEDKGLISYHGKAQAAWLYELLEDRGLSPVLSLRHDQWPEDLEQGKTKIYDRFQDFGPMGGILSAMHSDSESAWLVLACDLPLIDDQVVTRLIEERDPRKMATAYLSTHDGMPEPLAAIYEPKSRMRLHEALALGYSCPRKVLLNTDIKAIELQRPEALVNANTQDEKLRCQMILREMQNADA